MYQFHEPVHRMQMTVRILVRFVARSFILILKHTALNIDMLRYQYCI